MPIAVVTGSTGQTGGYLVDELINSGWQVHGISAGGRDESSVVHHKTDVSDSKAFGGLLAEIEPDAIVNLAALSNVAESWKDPVRATSVNCISVAVCLEHVQNKLKTDDRQVRFVQASSAQAFHSKGLSPLSESAPIKPISPYAATKAFGHVMTQTYREAGCHASNAILFNHESPRRPPTFVTRKITQAVAKISRGLQGELVLGPLDVYRDWGWAPDYAHALRLIVESQSPSDYVVATGQAHSIREFLTEAFGRVGISDWEPFVRSDQGLFRPTEEPKLVGDPTKIEVSLGWKRTKDFSGLVSAMVDYDLSLLD